VFSIRATNPLVWRDDSTAREKAEAERRSKGLSGDSSLNSATASSALFGSAGSGPPINAIVFYVDRLRAPEVLFQPSIVGEDQVACRISMLSFVFMMSSFVMMMSSLACLMLSSVMMMSSSDVAQVTV